MTDHIDYSKCPECALRRAQTAERVRKCRERKRAREGNGMSGQALQEALERSLVEVKKCPIRDDAK
jgi:hypothetical protein